MGSRSVDKQYPAPVSSVERWENRWQERLLPARWGRIRLFCAGSSQDVSGFRDGCSRLQFEAGEDLAVEFTAPSAGDSGAAGEKADERRSAYWTASCDVRIVWANFRKT